MLMLLHAKNGVRLSDDFRFVRNISVFVYACVFGNIGKHHKTAYLREYAKSARCGDVQIRCVTC